MEPGGTVANLAAVYFFGGIVEFPQSMVQPRNFANSQSFFEQLTLSTSDVERTVLL